MASTGPKKLPEVVENVIALVAQEQGYAARRVEVESGSNLGDGYTSDLYRAKVNDTEGKKEDLHLMVKLSTVFRGNLNDDIFSTEGLMYDTVLPALQKVASLEEPLPWPRCYHVDVSGEPPHLLVLGDLRPDGYRMAARDARIDEAHCRHALTQLARLHGAAMALERQSGPAAFRAIADRLFNIFERPEVTKSFDPLRESMRNAHLLISDRFPEGSDVNVRLQRLLSKFVEDLPALMYVDPDGYNTFVHGDCHVNNMLFQYSAAGDVTGCRLYDFQTVRYGSPGTDLATLLLGCSDVASRGVAAWTALLRFYHDELQAVLRRAGCSDPDSVYPWDRFQAQMKRTSLYGLCMAPVFVNVFGADKETLEKFRDHIETLTTDEKQAAPPPTTITFAATERMKRHFGDGVQLLVDLGWLPTPSETDSLFGDDRKC